MPTANQNIHAGFAKELSGKFSIYEALLTEWQGKINLVSPASVKAFYQRHLIDSAQIFDMVSPLDPPIADFGSGAGFPGMVLAMMGIKGMELIESDARKCAFLHTLARETDTKVTIRNQRIETLPSYYYNGIVARGCAPLSSLLDLAYPRLRPNGLCVLLKGKQVPKEIEMAEKHWRFQKALYPSRSGDEGQIIHIRRLQPLKGAHHAA